MEDAKSLQVQLDSPSVETNFKVEDTQEKAEVQDYDVLTSDDGSLKVETNGTRVFEFVKWKE